MHDIAVIALPRPAGCPLLHTKSADLRGKVCSVRLDRSGRMDELAALLQTQKPAVLVVSALQRLSGRDVQRVTDLAFRHCPNVSIVGSFGSTTSWGDAFPVRISGVVRAFCLMDPEGSMRGNDVIVYGLLERLELLTISADCRVHLSGMMAPSLNASIRARRLTINGYRAPVDDGSSVAGTESPPTYMFKTVPVVSPLPLPPQQPQPQLYHPQPRRVVPGLHHLTHVMPAC